MQHVACQIIIISIFIFFNILDYIVIFKIGEIMKDKLVNIFNETINPITNKTLAEEDRLEAISENNGEFNVIYKRDGLNPSQKNELEDLILKNFSSTTNTDNIILNSISKNQAPKAEEKNTVSPHAHGNDAKSSLPTKQKIKGVSHVVAVSSCKGGVGKSTVAVNLAFSLKQQGFKVGLMDTDIYGPSLPTLLGKEDLKPQANEDNKIMPFEHMGVKFISFGHFVDQKDPVIWRGPMLGGVIKQFAFDTEWGELDYLILDLPPGTGDVQLSISQLMDTNGAIVVSTPQQVAISDSVKGLKMFEKINIPVIGMVENMSYFMPEPEKKYFIFGKKSVKDVASQLETNFLASIPIDLGLCEAAEDQVPFMAEDRNLSSSVGKIYLNLAEQVQAYFNEPKKKGFINRLLNK